MVCSFRLMLFCSMLRRCLHDVTLIWLFEQLLGDQGCGTNAQALGFDGCLTHFRTFDDIF